MIRPVAWFWHRLHGDRWARRAQRHMRVSREAFKANRLCAERARAHFARADDLYPPPVRGPPDGVDPADGDDAPAHHGRPQIR